MKNINRLKIYFFCSFFSVFLITCKKEMPISTTPFPDIVSILGKIASPQDPSMNKYVWLLFNQFPDYMDSTNAFTLDVFANFKNDTTRQMNSGGNVIINNSKTIAPDGINNYAYRYTTSEVSAVKSMLGSDVTINVTGSPTVDSITRTLYVPKRIFLYNLNLNHPTLANNQPFTITWTPDSRNMFSKVLIQITYLKSNSIDNNPNNPQSVPNLLYTVNDNGSFTIPSSGLARFPVTSFVTVSITRLSDDYYATSRSHIHFISVVSGYSSSMLIQN